MLTKNPTPYSGITLHNARLKTTQRLGGAPEVSKNSISVDRRFPRIFRCKWKLRVQRVVAPAMRPPISSAARFLGLRVHLDLDDHLDDFMQCNANDWDGKLSNNLFTPVMTDTNAAPDEIKRVVSCKFKANRYSLGNSRTCSCRKYG